MLETAASTDFRSRVADFYRSRGYQVRENCRVRGESERVYAVDMVSQGPLGNLLVSFGDAGGVDPMELGRVRQIAKDIGATPVMAAPELDYDMRQLAAQMAVVVVDEATLRAPGDGVPMIGQRRKSEDFLEHPWPKSGRADEDVVAEPEPIADPAPEWPSGDVVKDVEPDAFDWLAPKAEAKPALETRPEPVAPSPIFDESTTRTTPAPARPASVADHLPPSPAVPLADSTRFQQALAGLEESPSTPPPRIVNVEAAPVELPPIEVEETLISAKAVKAPDAQTHENRLLWIVLGTLVVATAVYIGVLVL